MRSLSALEQELELKVANFPNPANATVGRRTFVRSKVKLNPKAGSALYIHDLGDMLLNV